MKKNFWFQWLPWRYVIRRIARAQGFIDPISLLGRLHRFQQPSEVMEPLELLRAGVVFHARGLINAKAIQFNLDWIWPYWVEKQFQPQDESFIPRAFSITHVNLTHRNWTAVGYPGGEELPIVDPRGLLMPFWDSWSLDSWIIGADGDELLPSRLSSVSQRLETENGVAITTEAFSTNLSLRSTVDVELINGEPLCRMKVSALAPAKGWLVISLRPYNPEGVSFIHRIEFTHGSRTWAIDDKNEVRFHENSEVHLLSNYRQGDVYSLLHHKVRGDAQERHSIECNVGMATAAMVFAVEANTPRSIEVDIPLLSQGTTSTTKRQLATTGVAALWKESLKDCCVLSLPDKRLVAFYEAALRTLILHSPREIYPGPYTYRRFWFRDGTYILSALLNVGLFGRAKKLLEIFPERQRRDGYFQSQEGEWDSNGQVLWIFHRYLELSGDMPSSDWLKAVEKAVCWIVQKRLPSTPCSPHAGLLPAGFSAEHLGPNDYYYWDNFWSVAGLQAAAAVMSLVGDSTKARQYEAEAKSLMGAIEQSLSVTQVNIHEEGMPAAPYRRIDSGAIGSIAVGYPLQLWAALDSRLLATVKSLRKNFFVKGAFFQDMIHSGVNAYLTLQIAQILLRARNAEFFELLMTVADLASPTGQWPEAIHPFTGGGCMGDGQHAWAAAEWILLLRNCFVQEENNRLVIASGIVPDWLRVGETLRCGPTPTRFGQIEVKILPYQKEVEVTWKAKWHHQAPPIEVCIMGAESLMITDDTMNVRVARPGYQARS